MSEKKNMSNFKQCCWCCRYGILVEGKKYCEKCDKGKVKECKRCKKPYDHVKYFLKDPSGSRCNSCQSKYLKERELREKRKLLKQEKEVPVSFYHNQTSSEDKKEKISCEESKEMSTSESALTSDSESDTEIPECITIKKKDICGFIVSRKHIKF